MEAAYYATLLSVLIGVLTFTTSQAYNAAIKAELEAIQQFFPAAARTWRWVYAGSLTVTLVWLTLYAASEAELAEAEEQKEVKKEAKQEAKMEAAEIAKALGAEPATTSSDTPQPKPMGMQRGGCACSGCGMPTTIRVIS